MNQQIELNLQTADEAKLSTSLQFSAMGEAASTILGGRPWVLCR